MKRFVRALFATVVALAMFAAARPAHAIVVERIVAIVGERPILLSELRHRARPRLTLIALNAVQAGMDPANIPMQLAGAEPKAMKDTLDEMIDERLMEQQADKARLTVSIDEVDRGIKAKAQQLQINEQQLWDRAHVQGYTDQDYRDEVRRQLQVSEQQLWDRAHVQGYTDQDYRDEVRRQLLEGKLLQLRLAGRIHVTDADARATYDRVVKQLGEESPVDLQVIYMRIPQSAGGVQAKEALAQDIVLRARNGESFCELVKQFNDDTETQASCGSRGPQPSRNIIPAARKMLSGMKEGDISDPIRIGDQVVIVFKLAKRERIPKFEDVKEQMEDQATEEAILHQRAVWVQELRRTIYLDIKL